MVNKTCFTCKNFEWYEGGPCGNGTCSDSSRLQCRKGLFDVPKYSSEKEMEEAILTAVYCSDYEAADGK